MIKLVALLKKKEGLSRQDLMDYYERVHAPLACKLLPAGHIYRRNYPYKMRVNGQEIDSDFDCDVITEMYFKDQEAYDKFAEAMKDPVVFTQIVEDESRFLDRSAHRIMMVEVKETQF